jgi:2-keto-3-deoxy-galactonokinase
MARTLGLGTLVKVDDDDSGSTFTTVSLVTNLTPPGRKRVRVDGTALADTLATDEAGIEDKSDFVYNHFHEPNETNANLMDTLFGAKTQVIFTITYASTDVETFEGIVMGLQQAQIVQDNLLAREVTIHRRTASTWS